MTETRSSAAESGQELMPGPTAAASAIRGPTKDNLDGTVTVTFTVNATTVHKAFMASPEGSVWLLDVESDDSLGRFEMLASRGQMKDLSHGKVELRFIAMATAASAESLYGRKGQAVLLTMTLMVGRNPHPYLIDRSERSAVMTRSVVMCTDPSFAPWIEQKAREEGYPTVPESESTSAESRATEHLYRVAQINSRREILTSNPVAERVEGIMREYREALRQRKRGVA